MKTERPLTVDLRTEPYLGSVQRTDCNVRPQFVVEKAERQNGECLRIKLEPASLLFYHRVLMFLLEA